MLTLPHQKLIKFLDDAMRKQKYGTVNLTVIVKNGIPVVETAKLVKMKRVKYKTIGVDRLNTQE